MPSDARDDVHDSPANVLASALALAERGLLAEALELTGIGSAAVDPVVARSRADWAMRLRRYDEAVAAADVAIGAMLHAGVSVEQFIAFSLRGAQAEGLMRVERGAVARLRVLHEPLALRWEALRRGGRVKEARQMRALCIRHFPERASVWAAAGNQALDEGEATEAEYYFDQCLQHDSSWTAGLAGKAIVLEMRKDWAAALVLRARVVQVERSLDLETPASLQRVIRYAAALGRIGRWADAAPLFRRCARLGAFECLPAERPVLLRVFSHELYAPSWIARMLQRVPSALAALGSDAQLAMREAYVLSEIRELVTQDRGLGSWERRMLLGMCAWLEGDYDRAYPLLDETEEHHEEDVATQYLLWTSAIELCAGELASIAQFARESSLATVARLEHGESVSDDDIFYALVIMHSMALPEHASAAAVCAKADRPMALLATALEHAGVACPQLAAAIAGPLGSQLRTVVAFRAAQHAVGRPPREAAAASVAALEAIVGAVRQ